MVSLFQEFEFVYPEGELFYDTSGALTRRLREVFPGMVWKETELSQRQFSVPSQQLSLLIGVAVSRLQTIRTEESDFGAKAALFLESVSEFLEIDTLNRFSFKHVIGMPVSTDTQAQELMWPVLGEDLKAKLASVSPSWSSVQGEFTQGPFTYEARITVMDLTPPPHWEVGKALVEKMRNITFPAFQCAGATLEEAIEYLSLKSRDLDASETDCSRRGVTIEVKAALGSNAQISLDLKDIPMLEALQYVVELAGVQYKLGPDRVIVVDLADAGTLPHITFHLQVTGRHPITVAEFDVAAFIKNFREKHSEEICSKLAPHLSSR